MNRQAKRFRMLAVLAVVELGFLAGCGGGSGSNQAAPPQQPASSGQPSQPSQPGQLTMTTARAEHTATLLSDGRVLVTGGFGGPVLPNPSQAEKLASAELYDPATGVFTPTGSMTRARIRHTATLLADGRVLIVGGEIDTQTGGYEASAEIYDPATGAFSATGNMISSGASQSVLLPDNKVFIAAQGNAEVYNPASGTFALTGPYTNQTVGAIPAGNTATLLPNGNVLVDAVELFNPTTDAFTPTGTGSTPSWDTVTATVLLDGTVLFVEGNSDGFPDNADVYDPASGTFTQIGPTNAIHEFSTATRLPDGTVLVAGGQLPGGNGSRIVERYLPATGMFTPAANMASGRHAHTATLLQDGTVLIAGGYGVWPNPTASAEIYKK